MSTRLRRSHRTSARWRLPRRGTALLTCLVLALGFLTFGWPAVSAQAYEAPTGTWTAPANSATQVTFPSGLTATVSVAGKTTLDTTSTLGSRGWDQTQYSPSTMATGDSAVSLNVATGDCASTGTCTDRGTVTITFSQPVRNPIIHLAGMGASATTTTAGIITAQSDIHAVFNLSTAGVTLSKAAGNSQFSVTSTQVTATNDSTATNCTTNKVTGANTAAGTAACGSVQVDGTVTTLTFAMSAALVKNPNTASATNSSTTADGINLAITTGQDFGDAPASYDGTQAAAHTIGDLTLGSGVTADNPNVRNSTTSPNAGSGATGDTDDAFTSLPAVVAEPGYAYNLTVPVSSVSSAATLCGWIDFDKSGTFDTTAAKAEQSCTTVSSGATSAALSWTVPSGTTSGTTYARFRIGYTASQITSKPTGLASSGEVEDYQVTLAPRPTITVRKTTLGSAGGPFGFTLTNTTQASGTVTTTAAGTATTVDGDTTTSGTQSFTATKVGTAVTITESTFPSGWALSSASCTDGSQGVGTLSGSVLTLPASAIVAGAAITCDIANGQPSISLTKKAGTASGATVGSTIPYTFTVTNTGQTPLKSIAVTDAKVGTVSCADSNLAIGASTTCTASYTLTQIDIDAGSVVNNASVSGTPPTGAAVTATATATKAIPASPAIDLTKTAGTLSGTTAGSTLGYSFLVKNTGNVTLTGVAVADPKVTGVSCPATTLAPGASTTCTATYTLTQADVDAGTVANTAAASGTPPTGAAVTDADTATKSIDRTATITLKKTASAPSANAVNGTIGYSFLVKNTGNVTLAAIAITDAKAAGLSCPSSSLAPGASMTCTATHTLTQTDLDAGSVTNNASVTGTPPTGMTAPTATDSATTGLTRTPGISLDKQYSGATGASSGSQLSYTFVVVNTGNVTLTGVTVTDARVGTVTCAATTLVSGAATSCTGSATLTQSEVDAGHLSNTASVTGAPPTGLTAPTATDSVDTTVAPGPALTLRKSAASPTAQAAGGTILYSFLVANTGNVTLTSLGISDSLVGAVTCSVASLAPGTNTTCTASHTLTQGEVNTGSVVNTATASAAAPSGTIVSATDSTTSTLKRTTGLTLDKQVGTASGNTVGATVPYSFVITNTGNVTLAGMALTDSRVSSLTCPATNLAPGATITCTATATLTQTDVDAGHVANTANVTATPPTGLTAPTATDATDIAITRGAGLTLDKQAGTPTGNTVGSTIAYTFVLVNTGNVTLTSVQVNDAKVGTVSCPSTTLAPGASITCTAVYPLTQADLDTGSVHNSATAGGTPPAGMTAPSATDTTDTTLIRTATLTLDKQAGTPSGNTAGSTIGYTFIVKNTGNVTVTSLTVTDRTIGTVSCPVTTLAPGATTTCTAGYTLTQDDIDAGKVTNSASATATPPAGVTAPTAGDQVTTTIAAAASLTLAKSAAAPTGNAAGDSIAYTFVVKNTGNVTLHDLGIADAKVPAVTCPVTTLAPGATTTCTATHTLTQADIDAGTLTNTATATASPPTGAAVSANDSTQSSLTRTAQISVDKQAGSPSGHVVGATIGYTFVVVNTGNVTLTGIRISDAKVGSPTCLATTLVPGAGTECTATYTLTQDDIDAGHVANTATATGTAPTGVTAPTAHDSTDIAVDVLPALVLDKQAGTPTGSTPGATLAYTFVVTNTGNATVLNLAVTDPMIKKVSCPDSTLAPGSSTSCTGSYALTQDDIDAGHIANTATASGLTATGTSVQASDSTDAPMPIGPAIGLVKHAGKPTGTAAGATVDYTFAVTNTGNVTLHGVTVADPKAGTVSCPVSTLAPAASTTCSVTYTLTQADVDAGGVTNTATASGTPPNGTAVTATSSVTTPISASPSVTLDKQASTPSGNISGSAITYTFVIANTGNVTLSSIAIGDDLIGTVSCPITSLAPGTSTSCTAVYSITQDDVDAGSVDNHATVTAHPPVGAAVTGQDSTATPIEQTETLTLVKSAKPATSNAAGGTIDYTFLVTNTGNVTLDDVEVDDPKVGPVTCPQTSLDTGASVTCAATYTLTQPDVDAGKVVNAAAAYGTPQSGHRIEATDSVTSVVPRSAAITFDKQAPSTIGTTPGAQVPYTFIVSNTGNVTLTDVTITDQVVGPPTCLATTLAPGASTQCSATYSLTQADIDAGHLANTADATATAPAGVKAPAATDSTDSPISASAGLALVKHAGIPSGTTEGSTVGYTFALTNTGNVTLHSVTVTDALVSSVSCPVSDLAPGATTTCSGTHVLTQAEIDAGAVTNTAHASGLPPTGSAVTATDSVTSTIDRHPAITLDKQADTLTGNAAGTTAGYTFLVTNTGNVTLTSIAITDAHASLTGCTATSLAPGASLSCTGTATLSQAEVDAGHVANAATVTGTSPEGPKVTAADTTDVAIAESPALTVVKSAGTPSGDVTGSTIVYSFLVTNTGSVTLTGVGVTDPKIAQVGCPVTTLAPGAATTCTATYRLTQADVDAGNVTNTATATAISPSGTTVHDDSDAVVTTISVAAGLSVDKRAGRPSDDALGGTIAYNIVVTNTGNVTLSSISVDDPLVQAVTCPATTLAPATSVTCTANYALTQQNVDAGAVTNTATVTALTPKQASVEAADDVTSAITRTPGITLHKQAGTPTGNAAGSTIEYSFTATNTGNVTLDDITVTDPLVSSVTCDVGTLAPGAVAHCTGSHALTQPEVDAGVVNNTAQVAGTPPSGSAVVASDTTSTTIPSTPGLTVDKRAGKLSGTSAGSTIQYTFVVSNTGNVTLTLIHVIDTKTGYVTCPTDTLAPGSATTCTLTYSLTQEDVDSGHLANTATVYGKSPTSELTSASDSTDTTIPAGPAVSLVKSAEAPSGSKQGSTIAYSFLVSNIGNVRLTSITVADAKVTSVTCPRTSLDPGQTTTCTATYTLTQADLDAGLVTNTATVTGTAPGGATATDQSDQVSTTIAPHPGLKVTKSAATPSGTTADSTVVYTFTAANTGNVTLTSVSVTDPLIPTLTCTAATLAPGDTTSCTGTYHLTQTDVDAGAVTNTATGTGTTPANTPVTDTSNTVTTTIAPHPGLTMDKEPGTLTATAAGTALGYTFAVQNTGNVTLTLIHVVDDRTGQVSCPSTVLAPGESTICTANYTLTQADVNSGHVANSATAYGKPPTGSTTSAGDSTDVDISRAPQLELVKSAATPTGAGAGSTIDYTFEATNTGNVTLSAVGVTDPLIGALNCYQPRLEPGQALACTATYTLTQGDIDAGHVTNTATATATTPTGASIAEPSAPVTTQLAPHPAIEVDKHADAPTGNAAGASIDYTFTVTNTGNVTLSSVGVTDPRIPTLSCAATTLAPGHFVDCTATYTLTQDDADAGVVTNTATATGTAPNGDDVTDTSGTVRSVINGTPAITVVKHAGTPTGTVKGSTIDYTFDVTNNGNVTLTGVVVNDPKVGHVSCPDETLLPDQAMTCTAGYTLTQADVDAGTVDNEATATGTAPNGDDVTAASSVSSPILAGPGLDLVKRGTANGERVGSTISYRFSVTNTGNVTLTRLAIADTHVSDLSCPQTTLAPSASIVCTASYTLTQADVDAGTVHNEATASAQPPSGDPIEDSDATDVPVTAGPAMDVVKTAGSITDTDANGVDAGDSLAYTVAVTNTGNVTLHDLAVTDPLISDLRCPQTTLAPAAVVTCTGSYLLTQADLDAGSITNTAGATADAPGGGSVSGTDSVTTAIDERPALALVKSSDADGVLSVGDTVTFSFLVTNTGNVTVTAMTLTDPMLAGLWCPGTTLAPGASMTCTGDIYTVTSKDAARGRIVNDAVASASFCPPSGCVAVNSESAVTVATRKPATSADSDLAYTGADVARSALLGAGILSAGMLLLLAARRRRT